MGKLMNFFKGRQQQELYYVKILFFSFLLTTYCENIGQKFPFPSDNAYFKCT